MVLVASRSMGVVPRGDSAHCEWEWGVATDEDSKARHGDGGVRG